MLDGVSAAGAAPALPARGIGRAPAVGILPTDHYILKKLYREVLPWIVAARRVDTQWFVRFATADAYLADIMAALAGLGIGAPLIALFSGKLPAGKNAMEVLRETLPGIWFVIGLVALCAYILLRVVVKQENVVSRALFARDIVRTMKSLNIELFAALPEPNPMVRITQIQKSINDSVANATKNGVWPYNPLPPHDTIAGELDRMTGEIREQFMSVWAPAPPAEQG